MSMIRREVAALDPNLPIRDLKTMQTQIEENMFAERIMTTLSSGMAGLALLLSAIGIFALVANIVAQKTREIGIRIALGSSIRQAMIHIGGPGVRASVLGLVLGLILCAGALRAMQSVLYGVGVYDGPTILTVVILLTSVTVIATAVPTLRIAGIDPAKTLREE